jgi:hypothetical protein
MYQPIENAAYDPDGATHDLWDRILGLIEQDLEERRSRKLFVEVRDESGSSCEKEIGELSAEERRSLHPVLREHVVERLLDRHLAEQGRVDLLAKEAPLYQGDPGPHPGGPAGPHSSRPAEGRGGVSPRANGVCSRGASGPGAVLRRGTRRDCERDAAMK